MTILGFCLILVTRIFLPFFLKISQNARNLFFNAFAIVCKRKEAAEPEPLWSTAFPPEGPVKIRRKEDIFSYRRIRYPFEKHIRNEGEFT